MAKIEKQIDGWLLALANALKATPSLGEALGSSATLIQAPLSEEIETPGDGQIRGLVTLAGNPVLSTPNSERLAGALDQLEFMVSINLYLNELGVCHSELGFPTTRHETHYIRANLELADMGVLAAGNLMGSGGIGQQLQKQVGQTGIPVYNVSNACATGATALRTAIMAVKAGECDMGLACGVEKLAGAGLLGAILSSAVGSVWTAFFS